MSKPIFFVHTCGFKIEANAACAAEARLPISEFLDSRRVPISGKDVLQTFEIINYLNIAHFSTYISK